jgi:hypothetical protein
MPTEDVLGQFLAKLEKCRKKPAGTGSVVAPLGNGYSSLGGG